jgi:hypothetical protein
MHWCLGDVLALHGTLGYDATATGMQYVPKATSPVYYPDQDPAAQQPHYLAPDPTGSFPYEGIPPLKPDGPGGPSGTPGGVDRPPAIQDPDVVPTSHMPPALGVVPAAPQQPFLEGETSPSANGRNAFSEPLQAK